MKALGEVNHYLGMHVTRSANGIKIDQESYSEDILRRFRYLLDGFEN